MSAPPEEHIRRTISRYCMLLDDGRLDEWAELFTEDARLHVLGTTHEGRAAIRRFIEPSAVDDTRGTHLSGNVLIRVDSWNGAAQVWTDYLVAGLDGSVLRQGRYHDLMERGGDKTWRFTLREIVFRGDTPQLTDPPPARDDD